MRTWNGKTWLTFLICLIFGSLLIAARNPLPASPLLAGVGGAGIGLAMLWLSYQEKS